MRIAPHTLHVLGLEQHAQQKSTTSPIFVLCPRLESATLPTFLPCSPRTLPKFHTCSNEGAAPSIHEFLTERGQIELPPNTPSSAGSSTAFTEPVTTF